MVAINLLPGLYTVEKWKSFFQRIGGGGDVLFAQDTHQRAADAFNVMGLGTTIVVDREGQVVYRDSGATPYDILRAEVDKAL